MLPFVVPVFFSLLNPCLAEEGLKPQISNVALTINQKRLFISFDLVNGMPPAMEELIRSGVPVRYIFNIVLKKKGFLWDDELKSIELRRTISFDNLRNRFFIYFDYPTTRMVSLDRLENAKKFLFSIRRVALVPLEKLEKGKKYTIEIKARCEKGQSSMPFSKLVKIFSSFGFSSKTYEFEFTF